MGTAISPLECHLTVCHSRSMRPETWLALGSLVIAGVTVVVGAWTTRLQLRAQAASLDRQLKAHWEVSEATAIAQLHQAHQERVWDTRAKAYADFVVWLRGSLQAELQSCFMDDTKVDLGEQWRPPPQVDAQVRMITSQAVSTKQDVLADSMNAFSRAFFALPRDWRGPRLPLDLDNPEHKEAQRALNVAAEDLNRAMIDIEMEMRWDLLRRPAIDEHPGLNEPASPASP
jgi:hypothetical protein